MRNIKTILATTLIAGSALIMTACSSDHVAQSGEATVESTTITQELPTEVKWKDILFEVTDGTSDGYFSPDGKYHEDLSQMEKIDPQEKFPMDEPINDVVFYSPPEGIYNGTYADECTITPRWTNAGNLQVRKDCAQG